jgi:hypothetical protein
MAAALTPRTDLDMALSIVELRRRAAFARALLEELDHLVPQSSTDARDEIVSQELIEELTRLGCRILECAATMARDFEASRCTLRHDVSTPSRLPCPQSPNPSS